MQPDVLPGEFWNRPVVRNALATFDVPVLMDLVREEHCWRQADLADVLGYSQTWVSRAIAGKRALTVEQVRHISDRLGIPVRLLRLGGVDDTRRRDFMKLVGVTGLHVTAPAVAHDAPAAALRAITGAQRRLDATSPARDLADSAAAHLDLARRQLARATVSDRRQVAAAVSEAAGFAAWLQSDMLDIGSARGSYRTAIVAARHARDGLLAGYMLGSLAAFELDADEPDLAIDLLAEAAESIGDRPHPTTEAWLSSTEALAHATRQDARSARGALKRAERAIQREPDRPPPWPWLTPFSAAKVAGRRALVSVRLGRPAEAAAAFAEARPAAQPAVKQHAALQLEVAAMHAQSGDADQAFALAGDALAVGVTYRSDRIMYQARRFRHRITGPLPSIAAEFDVQLAATR